MLRVTWPVTAMAIRSGTPARTMFPAAVRIGHITVGMARQGFDLQLTQYDERGWRATFYTTGMEPSPTSATGTGWERTLWRATQRAAWVPAPPAKRWRLPRAVR